ncbi:MAG: helix-turn-helix transcriptional regulator, partial [Cyanobacteria bacterium P01_E01_bin.35]
LSPHKYVIQQRIERAKQLLNRDDRSIADIALECGFNSHAHLNKYFRDYTGMTPKAYRQS